MIKPARRSADLDGMELSGKRGEGAFQWNFGGWFGSQVGSTLWLVILGFVMIAQSKSGGTALVVFGLAANLIGIALWRRRRTLSPYPAIQILIAVCGLAALFAMLVISASGQSQASTGLPTPWFLLVYPGLMLAFHFQERAARRANAQRSPDADSD